MSNSQQIDKTQDLDFVRKATLDTIAKTMIHSSELHGFGLFATDAIKDEQILYLFDGQVVTIADYEKIESLMAKDIAPYSNYIFMECNYLNNETLLVRNFRTKYSYINHSRTPNTEIRYHPMRLVAIKEIQVGEELTIDYRKEQLSDDYLTNPEKQFL
ncbi:SET domain-containing protein [Shewanella sp. WPAGA9]|uniref:SET domain-containing protein n=1 Tax=Shewanella sp. ENK2 TaxID=2775245 RepID=UPI001782CE50|nr:SET domain-containing protein [Shewanella sp. WPAGA9]